MSPSVELAGSDHVFVDVNILKHRYAGSEINEIILVTGLTYENNKLKLSSDAITMSWDLAQLTVSLTVYIIQTIKIDKGYSSAWFTLLIFFIF